MDRQISYKEQSKVNYKKWVYSIVGLLLLCLSIYGLRSLLKNKADKSDFFIATVEKGDVTNTITASEVVIPAFEWEINAPVATEIKSVNLSTGVEVKKGDLILELDQEYTKLEYDQLKDELDLRKNNIEKLKLKFDKDLRDLDYRDQIKALQVDELKAEVSDQKRLLDIGSSTKEELEQAQLKLKVLKLEKNMLENELQYSRNVNEKKGLELEYTIQEKRLKELRKKLKETSVRSPQVGVITWINEDIGRTNSFNNKWVLKALCCRKIKLKTKSKEHLKPCIPTIGKKDIPVIITCEISTWEDDKILDKDGLVRQANKNRQELKRYARELLQNEQTIAQTKAEYGIKAELFASFGFARGSEDLNQIYRNPFDEQQVRLNVSMPIVD